MSLNWMFRRLLIGPITRLFFPMHVVGRENLPTSGPFIIAAGPHRTELESVILASNLAKYEIHFFAKASYWEKSPLHRWFMNGTGQLPISQMGGRGVEEQIQAGVDALREGGIVAIYPEGTRGGDRLLHKGHTGVARTAILANAPIVPIGMIGMERLNPPGRGLHPGRGTIIIGEPIYPLTDASDEDRSLLERALALLEERKSPLVKPTIVAHARLLTGKLMREISRLSTAPYADSYLEIGGLMKRRS